jgi:Tfp pilus assembly protein PilO
MTLLRRVAVDKRPLIVPLVVAIVANVAVYVLAVYPLSQRKASVQERATAAAAARVAAEEELAAARALVEGKSRAEEELTTFYGKVLPADLTAARRMTYTSLPSLARKTDVAWSSRRTQIEEATDDGRLGRLTIRMALEGDYENIRQFIFELESAPEFIIIDDVTLAQNQAGRPLTLNVTLSAYYRLGPNGV